MRLNEQQNSTEMTEQSHRLNESISTEFFELFWIRSFDMHLLIGFGGNF